MQFRLDGSPLGGPDTTAPFQAAWDTTTSANGSHTLTASATDAAGNIGTATAVAVTVANATPPPPGLVGAWSFNAGSGTTAADSSGLRQHRHAQRSHMDLRAVSSAAPSSSTASTTEWTSRTAPASG